MKAEPMCKKGLQHGGVPHSTGTKQSTVQGGHDLSHKDHTAHPFTLYVKNYSFEPIVFIQ